MSTRELLIREINQAPEDLLQILLHYLQTEQQRRKSLQDTSAPQTVGPYADYWNQFVGAADDGPWERPPQGNLEQRVEW